MFNLDQTIANWRRQMAAGGIKRAEVLDELESHLREDIEAQMRSGTDAQRAFEVAVERIGRVETLKPEFAKPAPLPSRPALVRAAYVTTGVMLVLISAFNYWQFELSLPERILGMAVVSFMALYLACL